jgi:hypothetical protein
MQVLFALNYYVPNTPDYYLPAYVWLAVCTAAAAHSALSYLWRSRSLDAVWPHLTLVCVLAGFSLPVALCSRRWQGMDQVRAYQNLAFDHGYGQASLDAVKEGAVIVSDWQPATVLWYTQLVEGAAPQTQIVALDSLEWQWLASVEQALTAGRPTYLSRPVASAGEQHSLSSAGPLIQVLSEPRSISLAELPSAIELGQEIRLLGTDTQVILPGPEGTLARHNGAAVPSGSTLYVTVHWQAMALPSADYAVRVYLADASGNIWVEKQNRHPVYGTFPTLRWQTGEVVDDTYELLLPPDLPSGDYTVYAAMGFPFANVGLRDQHGRDRIPVASIVVDKPPRWPRPSPSVPLRKRCLADLVLMGYDGPRQVAAGESTMVSLLWLVRSAELAVDLPHIAIVGNGGERIALSALAETREDWHYGALVTQRYEVPVSEAFRGLEARRYGWTHRLPVRLKEAAPAVANFGDLIILRGYQYADRSVAPGGTVRLTLDWETMATIAERYKVFVHVLGENGLPIAQQDNEPLNGTFPTTRWQPGEEVADPYAFSLPADLAPGEYRVEVGLYRLADLSRLPVLDEDKQPVDDKVFLAPLVVE